MRVVPPIVEPLLVAARSTRAWRFIRVYDRKDPRGFISFNWETTVARTKWAGTIWFGACHVPATYSSQWVFQTQSKAGWILVWKKEVPIIKLHITSFFLRPRKQWNCCFRNILQTNLTDNIFFTRVDCRSWKVLSMPIRTEVDNLHVIFVVYHLDWYGRISTCLGAIMSSRIRFPHYKSLLSWKKCLRLVLIPFIVYVNLYLYFKQWNYESIFLQA